ncbi:MAG TPA: DUF2304 domain-containing protein [Acidimicrobiales bacterium]|nr:DUF2304 domain-containing protein [Acidimicrobiales bacterium]
MTTTAQVFLALVTLTSLVFVIRMVRRKSLQSKYSLLWLSIASGMVLLSIFPDTVDRMTEAVGVDYPPAALLAVAVAFLFVVIVQYSWELSRLEERTRVLAEEVALLKEAVRQMSDVDRT